MLYFWLFYIIYKIVSVLYLVSLVQLFIFIKDTKLIYSRRFNLISRFVQFKFNIQNLYRCFIKSIAALQLQGFRFYSYKVKFGLWGIMLY